MSNVFKSIGGIFGSILGQPKAPTPPKPIPMPDLNDPQIQAQSQITAAQAAARSGRASTILSSDYSGTLLGG